MAAENLSSYQSSIKDQIEKYFIIEHENMIRPQIKIFGYSTIIYGVANLLTKIVSVALIPLYTKYLSVNDVGIIALFEMVEVFLVTFIPLGTITSMWRYLSEADENERNSIKVNTELGMIKIVQIAGLLARRILCYARKENSMKMGERLGFMRFGSRIDLTIPSKVNLKIKVGQKVIGNSTIIGTY